jgi:hypothetical protein
MRESAVTAGGAKQLLRLRAVGMEAPSKKALTRHLNKTPKKQIGRLHNFQPATLASDLKRFPRDRFALRGNDRRKNP